MPLETLHTGPESYQTEAQARIAELERALKKALREMNRYAAMKRGYEDARLDRTFEYYGAREPKA